MAKQIILDNYSNRLYVDDKIIELTPMECQTLALFIENKNGVKFDTNDYNMKLRITRANKKIKDYLKIVNINTGYYRLTVKE